MRMLTFFVLLGCCFNLMAQEKTDCDKVLDTEPYFVKNKSDEKDKALIRDIEILKRCGKFNSIDSAFLKGSLLGGLMLEEVNKGKPATYRTIINFFSEFRKTDRYKDFAYGLSLYQKIGKKTISEATWEVDKELFVRMGFTENDLEDFKAFMLKSENLKLSYLVVLTKYMTEIESMRVDK